MLQSKIDLVLKKRNDFIAAIEEEDPSNFIFIDESGANLGMASDYGRSEGGERLKMSKPMNRGDSYSIIGAIGIFGIIAMLYGKLKVCGTIFLEFITTQLVPKLSKKHVVFLDNASIHKSDSVREAIESTGATLVFLPPY